MAHTEAAPRWNRAAAGAALAATVSFAWLAAEVMRNATMPFDLAVRGGIHNLASVPLTWAMLAVTLFGSVAVLAAFGLIAVWRLFSSGRTRHALLLAIVIVGADVLDLSLKLVFHRVRPDAFFGVAAPSTYSFPSGHAIMSCAVYGALVAILAARFDPVRKAALWIVVALLVGTIGFSRVYLGVHYPTDVLGGYAVGVGWLAAVRAVYGLHRGKARRTEQARMSVPR
jgi:undecaprenyl-diphosphatase